MPIVRALTLTLVALVASGARGDDVLLKNKLLYRGTVDRDNTLRQVSDGLKRVIIRDSKIEKITPNEVYKNLERFAIVQPLEVHAGSMPLYAIGVEATPWNEKGRRQFRYLGPRAKAPIAMTQAINDLGPHMVRYRGVDGFWVGQVATRQVPKPIVLGLISRVDRSDLGESQRVVRFLLQAEWYNEAKVEAEAIAKKFPEERERAVELVKSIEDLDARQQLAEISVVRQSRRPRDLLARLRAFPSEHVAPEVLADAREQLRKEEGRVADDRRVGESLRELEKGLSSELAKAWKRPIAEVLKNLEEAPDVLRPRLEPFAKAAPTATPEARLALAMSGYVLGPDAATATLSDAQVYWKARGFLGEFLRSDDERTRAELLVSLQTLDVSKDSPESDGKVDLATLSRLIALMPPPRQAEGAAEGKVFTHRVADDRNADPSEYMVILPPEYHPLRSYPTIVALHDGLGPRRAIDWWAKEAARRGYIVVAPEYNVPGQPPDYRYSASEHAAIELSLRDARKRYAIDSDRVSCTGVLIGGNAALDFGLAHPDLFAGVASVSGVPAKFVFPYRKHVEDVPLYMAIGDLALGNREIVFDGFVKSMILDALDVTYVEYNRRGLEDLPEEAAPILDWIDKHRRDPYPKSFEFLTARPSDARFYGLVVGDHQAGRSISPEAADIQGKNIKPARITLKSSALSNLLNISTSGLGKLDVWVSPKLIDFKRRLEVRINNRAYFKGFAKPDYAPMLNDLRVRGDRQQLYWLKVSTGKS